MKKHHRKYAWVDEQRMKKLNSVRYAAVVGEFDFLPLASDEVSEFCISFPVKRHIESNRQTPVASFTK